MRKIVIVGTGYVGLVHGATLAELGNQVICLDIDKRKIEALQCGTIPFFEPGLEELVKRVVGINHLHFTDDYQEAISGADVCFMCLPTPSNPDESCNLTYLLSAARNIADVMNSYLVVVNKSTVPMGTAAKVKATIQTILDENERDIPFDVVSNPEFLREGSAVSDSMRPSRILIGTDSVRATKMMSELYAPFFPEEPEKLMLTDIVSAELAKYAANTMLASRISWMNIFSQLCEKMGGNIEHVRRAVGSDKRIGSSYLNAGLGFGGSCLPKDVKALRHTAFEQGVNTDLMDSLLAVNHRQRELFFEKIQQNMGGLKGKTLGIWGLSFKPNTDDLRDAPSLYIIDRALEEGASLRLYDPVAIPNVQKVYLNCKEVHFCSDEYDAATGAHAIALLTEWKQFQQVNFPQLASLMKEMVIFDGRNHLWRLRLERWGFDYFPIGIPHAHSTLVSHD